MSKIVSLTGEPIPEPGTPNEALIKDLEKLLEMARSGELAGVAVAKQLKDETTTWFYCGCVSFSMIGRLHQLQNRLLSELTES